MKRDLLNNTSPSKPSGAETRTEMGTETSAETSAEMSAEMSAGGTTETSAEARSAERTVKERLESEGEEGAKARTSNGKEVAADDELSDIDESGDEGEEEAGLYEHFAVTADKGQTPMRLDKFLTVRMEHCSRNRIQAAATAETSS